MSGQVLAYLVFRLLVSMVVTGDRLFQSTWNRKGTCLVVYTLWFSINIGIDKIHNYPLPGYNNEVESNLPYPNLDCQQHQKL